MRVIFETSSSCHKKVGIRLIFSGDVQLSSTASTIGLEHCPILFWRITARRRSFRDGSSPMPSVPCPNQLSLSRSLPACYPRTLRDRLTGHIPLDLALRLAAASQSEALGAALAQQLQPDRAKSPVRLSIARSFPMFGSIASR
jgi:hypothetical protein